MVKNNQVYTYHHNALGSTVAITNNSNVIINTYSYPPYGTLVDQKETIKQPFKYVGQYGVMTEANGLYYMRARYYDPATGRFISEDPAGFKGGLNLYAYVGGNPVIEIDPTGLVKWVDLGFGIVDFGLSTSEAVFGLGIMIGSTATGPATPAVFYGGLGVTAHGAAGMANSGLAIQNALYETNTPGLFEGRGSALFGDKGAKAGKVADLFTGLRPSVIAAGAINSVKDMYDIGSGINTMRNTFGNSNSGCPPKCF